MTNPNLGAFDPYSNTKSDPPPQTQSQPRVQTQNQYQQPTQPTQPTQPSTPSILSSLNQDQINFFLNQGYTTGLLKTLLTLKPSYDHQCWIVDNGCKMLVKDSHKLAFNNISSGIDNLEHVSRWEELMDCVGNQVWVSSFVDMTVKFALLNQPPPTSSAASAQVPQYFTMGQGPNNTNSNSNPQQEVQKIGHYFKSIQPNGPTNLSKQLSTIQRYIASISPQLNTSNQKVSVIIATQGLPTNDNNESNYEITQEFVQVLQSFNTLPVVITVRLCTDDEQVFNFYNSVMDNENNNVNVNVNNSVPFDVIDDYFGESLEVYLQNPWLTYGLSLHRFREMGLYVHVLDVLDEHLLTLDEVYDLCFILFDVNEVDKAKIPHPRVQWEGFLNAISSLMMREKQQWNPVTRMFSPWINIVQLREMYGGQSSAEHTMPGQSPFQAHGQTQQPQQKTQAHPQGQTYYQSPPTSAPPQAQQAPPTAAPTPSVPPPSQTQPVQSPTVPPPTDHASIKKNLLITWGLQAPAYQSLKTLPELLSTLQNALPPAFGVEEHAYFKKWKVLSAHALSSGGNSVVKRGQRKAKFLLHPDKLPRDLTENQKHVCKLVWDILADAWEAYEKQ